MTDQIPPQTIVEMAASVGRMEAKVDAVNDKLDVHIGDHKQAENNSRWAVRTGIAALGVAVGVAGIVLSGGCG